MLYKTVNPHGGDIYEKKIIYDFSANLNPLDAPGSALKAASNALFSSGHYPDPYCRGLTKAIAEFEAVPRDYILAGNGAAELIYSYVCAIRPKTALVTAPAFSEYEAALESFGAETERFTLSKGNDFDIDENYLKYLESTEADCIFICSPNNPTGRLIRPEILKGILDICSRRNIKIFADECFIDLSRGGCSLKPCLKDFPNLLLLKAFTKSFAMAGLRLGYALCADSDTLLAMSKTVQAWNVSLPAQAAGIEALKETEYLKDASEIISEGRNRLTEALKGFGWYVCPSDVNFILFKAFPGLAEKLEEEGIKIRDCGNYHGLCAGWYRIAVKLPYENEKLIEALKKITK